VTEAGRQRLLQAVDHEPPVGQLCQRVIKGELLDLVFSQLALGNVGKCHNVVGNLAGFILYRGDREPLGVFLAILALAPDIPLSRSGIRG